MTNYRALDMLTKNPPLVQRREPFWRPKSPTGPAKAVRTPAWSWESVSKTDGTHDLITVDVNGAYLAAISSAQFAHGPLHHTGNVAANSPGYYLIDTPRWQAQNICSPLGTVDLPARVWVMYPVVQLLDQVAEDGYLDAPRIHDSYTADTSCRFRKWSDQIRDDRAAVLDRIALARETGDDDAKKEAQTEYDAIKDGYSIATQMFLSKEDPSERKSKIFRPDWYETIRAQHAASSWRKCYHAWRMGCSPARMGGTDEITFTAQDWLELMSVPKPPFRLDPTGKTLGSVAIKYRQNAPTGG